MTTFGSLFAGIGGFDLGFERAGMRCEWQVEIDGYCRRVLEQHWPNVRRWDDVRTFPPAGEWAVDVICGGFPCQDISNAGKRAGIDGSRSGLWSEFIRVVRDLGPRYVLVENTSGLASRGMQRVLGDLAESGRDAEWAVLPASAFGLPHRRDRVFVLAYPAGYRLEGRDATTPVMQVPASTLDHANDRPAVSEPFGLRSADGLPGGVDELKCRINALGNSVVPQVAEWVGRRIVEMERGR